MEYKEAVDDITKKPINCNQDCFQCYQLSFDAGEPWCRLGRKTKWEE